MVLPTTAALFHQSHSCASNAENLPRLQSRNAFQWKFWLAKKVVFHHQKKRCKSSLLPPSLSLSVFLPLSLPPSPVSLFIQVNFPWKGPSKTTAADSNKTPIFTGTFSFFFLLFLQRDERHRLKMWMCANGFARLPEGVTDRIIFILNILSSKQLIDFPIRWENWSGLKWPKSWSKALCSCGLG